MREYAFDCPVCGNRYCREESIVCVVVYDDHMCIWCKESFEEEARLKDANAEQEVEQ